MLKFLSNDRSISPPNLILPPSLLPPSRPLFLCSFHYLYIETISLAIYLVKIISSIVSAQIETSIHNNTFTLNICLQAYQLLCPPFFFS